MCRPIRPEAPVIRTVIFWGLPGKGRAPRRGQWPACAGARSRRPPGLSAPESRPPKMPRPGSAPRRRACGQLLHGPRDLADRGDLRRGVDHVPHVGSWRFGGFDQRVGGVLDVNERHGSIHQHLEHVTPCRPLAEQIRDGHERRRGLHDRRQPVRDPQAHRHKLHAEHARELLRIDLAQMRQVADAAIRRVLVDGLAHQVIAIHPERAAEDDPRTPCMGSLEHQARADQVGALGKLGLADGHRRARLRRQVIDHVRLFACWPEGVERARHIACVGHVAFDQPGSSWQRCLNIGAACSRNSQSRRSAGLAALGQPTEQGGANVPDAGQQRRHRRPF